MLDLGVAMAPHGQHAPPFPSARPSHRRGARTVSPTSRGFIFAVSKVNLESGSPKVVAGHLTKIAKRSMSPPAMGGAVHAAQRAPQTLLAAYSRWRLQRSFRACCCIAMQGCAGTRDDFCQEHIIGMPPSLHHFAALTEGLSIPWHELLRTRLELACIRDRARLRSAVQGARQQTALKRFNRLPTVGCLRGLHSVRGGSAARIFPVAQWIAQRVHRRCF